MAHLPNDDLRELTGGHTRERRSSARSDRGLRSRVLDLTRARQPQSDAAFDADEVSFDAQIDSFLAEDDHLRTLSAWTGLEPAAIAVDAGRVEALIARDVAAIDALLGDQLDAILHHDAFQRLEACWRGAAVLVAVAGEDERVRVRLFNASWREICRDLERAAEVEASTLFDKIYGEEYGMPGGVPFGLLVCDYSVKHRAGSGFERQEDDIAGIFALSQVAAAAFSPVVLGASPELFGLQSFSDLSIIQRIDEAFRLPEYRRWRSLRENVDSMFVGVALPRVLLRDRYALNTARTDGFVYEEQLLDKGEWLWGNGAFAIGAMAIDTFRRCGWFVDLRGARLDAKASEGDGLAVAYFSSREQVAFRRPLEVELTDAKQRSLEDLGFLPISPCPHMPSITLLGVRSLHEPRDESGLVMRANATLSAKLNHVLCVCRFVHYIKIMARDKIGAFATPEQIERELSDWLRGYTTGNSDASAEMRARYPLAAARIEVVETIGKPGTLGCKIHIQPHFSFDAVATGLDLKTELHAPIT